MVENFKSDKQGEGIDRESVKTKHEDIRGIFLDRYPKDAEKDTSGIDFKLLDHFVALVTNTGEKFKSTLDPGRGENGSKGFHKCELTESHMNYVSVNSNWVHPPRATPGKIF